MKFIQLIQEKIFRKLSVSVLAITMIFPLNIYGPYATGYYHATTRGDAIQSVVPAITNLSPNSCYAGDPGFLLTVNGTNFIDGSIVKWNTTSLSTQYISSIQLKATVPASFLVTPGQAAIFVENPSPDGGKSNTILFNLLKREYIFLPLSIRSWPPQANVPVLETINNADQDNIYIIKWGNPTSGGIYTLEEAWDPEFTNAGVAYQGPNLSWTVPTGGKVPRTYYYRVRAKNAYMESGWSATQSITIYPLFVGLQGRWDGKGFLYIDDYYEPGTHETFNCDALTDADTIRCKFTLWYDPDPLGWGSESWNSFYSVRTGEFKSTDAIDDPIWKWGYSWMLGYNSWFNSGDTVKIYGQKFTVTGPHDGYTTYGTPIKYWEFINQDKFILQDLGDDLIAYVYPGEAKLRYDAGSSCLRVYDDVSRHYFYQGEDLGIYGHYISNLSAATSLPGSPSVPIFSSGIPPLDQPAQPLGGNNLEGNLRLGLPRE